MIIETSLNLKNKNKEELMLLLNESLGVIEKLQKENEELKFEERRRIIGKYGDAEIHNVINKILSNDYIPIQKVKDKIEEEKLPLVIVGGRRNKRTLEYGIKLGRRQALQELLEGRK